MSVPKIAGIETEYAIMVSGAEKSDPFSASQLLLNAYKQRNEPAVPCLLYNLARNSSTLFDEDIPSREDGTTDSPGIEASTRSKQSSAVQRERTIHYRQQALLNDMTDIMLVNGARFYIDHGHPEYSTPECLSPRLLIAADKAGERILAECQHWLNASGVLAEEQAVQVYKNNSDYRNNSYGCHENYLLSAQLFSDLLHHKMHRIFRYLLPFFVSRIVLCGSGKVGSGNGTAPVGFQLSQRADFFDELVGLQTTHERPLYNTRNEPHADPIRFSRLHVINGDANMSEFSGYLKIGTMQLILHMLEDDFIHEDLTLADPIDAFRTVSRDLSFQEPLLLEDGRAMTAVDIQKVYLEHAGRYLEERDGNEEMWHVLGLWENTLSMLPDNWEKLATRLDWAVKKRLLERYLSTQGVSWQEVTAWQPIFEAYGQADTEKKQRAEEVGLQWKDYEKQRAVYFALRRLDLEYHDIRYTADHGEIGLFYRLQQRGAIERLLTDEEIEQRIKAPPLDSRAWLRGNCIAKFSQNLTSADWGGMHFHLSKQFVGKPTQIFLDLPDPLMDTAAELSAVWHQFETPDAIIEHRRLASQATQETI
jgi:proteasome accessory factor A